MSCRGEEAERKFWRTPELVEKLFPLLDASSLSKLAQVHQLTVQALQNSSFWDQLIRKTCPYGETKPENLRYDEYEFGNWIQDKFEEHRGVMEHLVRILAKMDNPHICLMKLLHVICERYPAMDVRSFDYVPVFFQVSCPCKTSHSVSHLGFLLLEEVEGALGSAEQKLEKVSIDHLQEPWLSALSSRASRQQERWKWWKKVERVEAVRFVCANRWDLEEFLSLLQNCQRMDLVVVEIQNDLGEEGWADIAQAFPLIQGVGTIHAYREDMLSAKRGDLKAIWDALNITPMEKYVSEPPFKNECCWSVNEVVGGGDEVIGGGGVFIDAITEEEKEEEWKTLEEILDGTTFNWKKNYKQGY